MRAPLKTLRGPLPGLAVALALAAGTAHAGTPPAPRAPATVAPPEPQPVPVTLGSVTALAREAGWPTAVEVSKGAVRIGIRGENVEFDLFVQPASAADARGVQLVTFAVPQVAIVPGDHALIDEVLQRLMTLNWERVVGHWSWDRRDGEIRFEYVLLTADPLGLGEFVAAAERVATTVDDDILKIYQALGAQTPPTTTAGLAIERGEAPARPPLPRARLPRPPPPPPRADEDGDPPD
ncbi:YbjN domain-containing protein [Myxococcota bacterium]|nr:YbjN domain-containing protein [Myxococcota bacterium]